MQPAYRPFAIVCRGDEDAGGEKRADHQGREHHDVHVPVPGREVDVYDLGDDGRLQRNGEGNREQRDTAKRRMVD